MTAKDTKTKTKAKAKAKAKAKDKSNEKKEFGLLDVIRYPVVTEKSTNLSAFNQVTFVVLKCATKPQIKAAIESTFGVTVKAVNTIIRKGKSKRFKGREGFQEDVKKAIITLSDGQQLDLGSGI